MSRQTYNFNIAAAAFPLMSGHTGGTSLNQSGDVAAAGLGAGFLGSEGKSQILIPQINSVENCLPTARGWQSVYPSQQLPRSPGVYFEQILSLDCEGGTIVYLGISAGTLPFVSVLIKVEGVDTWVTKPLPLFDSIFSLVEFHVTKATIRGKSYFCIPYRGTYYFDIDTNAFVKVTLTGLVDSKIAGIAAGVNYLIAYDANTVYYSSPSNELLFTPALGQAGSSSLIQAKGAIIAAFSIQDGFIVYTAANAVAAFYSGNVNFPFAYKEVANSSGIVSPRHVAWETSTGQQFAFTSSGLQIVTKSEAKIIFSEVYDYIVRAVRQGEQLGNYSSGLFALTEGYETSRFNLFDVKLSFIGSRYVAVSYKDIFSPLDFYNSSSSDGDFSAALLYDISLARWGRLKLIHQELASYLPVSELIVDTWDDLVGNWDVQTLRWEEFTRKVQGVSTGDFAIAALCSNGKISRFESNPAFLTAGVDIPVTWTEEQKIRYLPKLIQGNITPIKRRGACMHEVRMYGSFPDTSSGMCFVNTELNYVKVLPVTYSDRREIECKGREVGTDSSIMYYGFFNISATQLTISVGGSR